MTVFIGFAKRYTSSRTFGELVREYYLAKPIYTVFADNLYWLCQINSAEHIFLIKIEKIILYVFLYK